MLTCKNQGFSDSCVRWAELHNLPGCWHPLGEKWTSSAPSGWLRFLVILLLLQRSSTSSLFHSSRAELSCTTYYLWASFDDLWPNKMASLAYWYLADGGIWTSCNSELGIVRCLMPVQWDWMHKCGDHHRGESWILFRPPRLALCFPFHCRFQEQYRPTLI